MCVFLCMSVWVLLVCWKNRLRYQKTAVLGWGKQFLFLINTSTVYNNICVYYAQFSSAEYKSSQTLHWFVFVHHHRLYILSWCSPLSRWEGRLSRSFSFRFHLFIFIWKLLLFVLCVLVWIYASLSLALCKLQRKLTTWNTCFCVCVFLVIKYSYQYN